MTLDSNAFSPLRPKLHHVGSLVLGGPDLCVHLPLTILPAQLASFRQKRAKSDSAGAAKKTQKRKGKNVSKDDGSTQDHAIEPLCQTASDSDLNRKTNDEVYHQLTWGSSAMSMRRWKKFNL